MVIQHSCLNLVLPVCITLMILDKRRWYHLLTIARFEYHLGLRYIVTSFAPTRGQTARWRTGLNIFYFLLHEMHEMHEMHWTPRMHQLFVPHGRHGAARPASHTNNAIWAIMPGISKQMAVRVDSFSVTPVPSPAAAKAGSLLPCAADPMGSGCYRRSTPGVAVAYE